MRVRECVECGSHMETIVGRNMLECSLCGHREEGGTVYGDEGIDIDEFDYVDDLDDILEVELVSV